MRKLFYTEMNAIELCKTFQGIGQLGLGCCLGFSGKFSIRLLNMILGNFPQYHFALPRVLQHYITVKLIWRQILISKGKLFFKCNSPTSPAAEQHITTAKYRVFKHLKSNQKVANTDFYFLTATLCLLSVCDLSGKEGIRCSRHI